MARKRKRSPAGCMYFLTYQEHLGQRRKLKGARAGGYDSLRAAKNALHRLAFSKRYNERLRGGDEIIVTKQCGLGDRTQISSSACRPTLTGTVRCRAYTGYTSDRKRSSADTSGGLVVYGKGTPGQSFESGGRRIETTLHRIGGVRKKRKRR